MGKAYNVTRNKLASLDFLHMTVTNNFSLHGDVTLQAGNNVGSLLFLVPTDNGVEHQDTDNDTKIDPVTQTSSEHDSKLHD